MNKILFVFVLGVGVLLGSCKQKETTSIVTDTAAVSAQHTADAVGEVAGDKELLRQAIILAEQKGTLESALLGAVQDSLVYIRLEAAVAAGRAAKQTASAAKPGNRSTSAGKATASKKSGDGFDKAEGAVDKAGHAVDRTTTIVNKASDVTKKAGDIFKGK